MTTIKLPQDLLNAHVKDEDHPDYDKLSVVSDKETGRSRWEVIHTLVVKYEGKLYRTTYRTGATESQENTYFDNYPDEIEVQEVTHVPVVISKYMTYEEHKKHLAEKGETIQAQIDLVEKRHASRA